MASLLTSIDYTRLHDFGVDFIQVIQQIEIYPGSSATFGSNAIGGAINLIMTGDYKDKINVNFDKDKNFDALINKNFQWENEVLNLNLVLCTTILFQPEVWMKTVIG